ncbi:MAG: hypothetical protein JRH20_18585, partial [Deltaproteobacteria bacterium]|nr:hypothetical protein [Deltaproteobacteria bacterium]
MRDKIKKDNLEFSEDELSELKDNLDNRASMTQSGRPRRRTRRRGVVVPRTLLSGAGPIEERPRTKTLPFLSVSPVPLLAPPKTSEEAAAPEAPAAAPEAPAAAPEAPAAAPEAPAAALEAPAAAPEAPAA